MRTPIVDAFLVGPDIVAREPDGQLWRMKPNDRLAPGASACARIVLQGSINPDHWEPFVRFPGENVVDYRGDRNVLVWWMDTKFQGILHPGGNFTWLTRRPDGITAAVRDAALVRRLEALTRRQAAGSFANSGLSLAHVEDDGL